MNKRMVPGILIAFGLCLSLQAVTPQKWEMRTKNDFLKGKFDGVSLSFDGLLSLAPKEDKIAGPTEEFYLSLLPLADGSFFLGTGHGGKIYLIGKDGKTDLYFQTAEMDVTCLVRDSQGNLFAGTSPNGKIYKIGQKGKGEEFFNPAEKYIWDLVFTESGTLLAAVGENGGIYEINPQGEGRQIVKVEENHILCLRKGLQSDVYAGSGGGGLIYRLTREGRVSVLFESPFEEIRSLALDKEGNLYASASGTSTKTKKEEPALSVGRTDAEATIVVSSSAADAGPMPGPMSSPVSIKEPGALFKISPDGVAKKLWSSNDEWIYSVTWKEEDKSILFGTGNKGRIYSIDKEEKVSLLLQENSEQVYLLCPRQTQICILANNPCYLGVLSAAQRFSGEYLSSVLDTKTVSNWGNIEWMSELGPGTTLQLLTRSGNSNEPNQTWSDWSPPYQKNNEQVLSPKARFLQFKALFRTPSGKSSPVLQRTNIFYMQTNIAPEFSRLDLLKPNEVFLKMPDQDDIILGMDTNPSGQTRKKDDARGPAIAKKVERKGFQTLIWEASDENGDALIYSISIRKEGETVWRLLQGEWEEPVFAFDTLSFPDGTYFLKITASDASSNPQGMELRSESISRPVVVDNSSPLIKDISVVRSAGGLAVNFQAEDSFSSIEEVQYLIRPGEWHVVFPVDGICDSKTERFMFNAKLPADSDTLIVVRVKDSSGNIGVTRQAF